MWYIDLLWVLLGVVIGGVAGFFLARKYFQKQIEKNPPINEKMIRAMFLQMGRKPSEAQIKAVMNSMKTNKK
ncbi:MAG: YneF family protein [Bacilli bacterium]|jgi:uncharacterized protein YneF (UPF0154 family)|nr:YneF family protein [Bacilli bacterium]